MAKKVKLTNGDDNFSGSNKAERIFGKAGDDNISGGGGNDVIAGGDGNDVIRGGSGDDTIGGGAGNDRLLGGSGDDTITASGNDVVDGGEGDDLINIAGNFADATVTKEGDTYVIVSGTETIRVTDVEAFTFGDGTFGTDDLDDKANGTDGITITLTTAIGENAEGTSGDDTINAIIGTGETLNTFDVVDGNDGDDVLNIVADAAVTLDGTQISEVERIVVNLTAAAAVDTSDLDDAEEVAIGGVDTDAVTLGAGQELTLSLDTGDATTVTVDAAETSTTITLDNTDDGEALTLVGAANTTLTVNGSVAATGAATINAAATTTTLNLGLTSDGAITVTGAALTTLDASTSTGDLTIAAPATVTTLLGGSGNDILTEGANGGGAVNGNGGQDDIILDITLATTVTVDAGESGVTVATMDTITNFNGIAGDVLDFNQAAGTAANTLIDTSAGGLVDSLTNANTAFAADPALVYFVSEVGGDAYVFVDTNGDNSADVGVLLLGAAGTISEADFVA